jgi:hypothetical protein
VNVLDRRVKRFRKHVIFKLKYNNLIFNEIMILNVSYVYLHAFSLRRESPDPDPVRQTPYF